MTLTAVLATFKSRIALFSPSFVSKIESWAIYDFRSYEVMVDTFGCFKPKRIRWFPVRRQYFDYWEHDQVLLFWKDQWKRFCLDSVTELELDL